MCVCACMCVSRVLASWFQSHPFTHTSLQPTLTLVPGAHTHILHINTTRTKTHTVPRTHKIPNTYTHVHTQTRTHTCTHRCLLLCHGLPPRREWSVMAFYVGVLHGVVMLCIYASSFVSSISVHVSMTLSARMCMCAPMFVFLFLCLQAIKYTQTDGEEFMAVPGQAFGAQMDTRGHTVTPTCTRFTAGTITHTYTNTNKTINARTFQSTHLNAHRVTATRGRGVILGHNPGTSTYGGQSRKLK